MKTVYLTSLDNEFQAGVLENVLQNAGIEYFLTNSVLSGIFGNIPGFTLQLSVFEKDYPRARQILEEGFPELVGTDSETTETD